MLTLVIFMAASLIEAFLGLGCVRSLLKLECVGSIVCHGKERCKIWTALFSYNHSSIIGQGDAHSVMS